MDIMKYGSDVEVLEPKELRQKVADELKKNVSLYS
jgi:predicted DNA-binding transcriptional regulator YafY